MNIRELVDRLKVEKKKPLEFLTENNEIGLESEVIYLDEADPEDYIEEFDPAIFGGGTLSITIMTGSFNLKTYHIYLWGKGKYDIIEETGKYN